MTVRDQLSEMRCYRALKADIEDCKKQINSLSGGLVRSQIFDTSGVPKSPASVNSTENRYIAILEKKQKLEKQIIEHEKQIRRIENYISNIYDKFTQYIFKQHIYFGKTFGEIARKLDDRPTEDGIKRRVYRALEDKPFTNRLDFDIESLFD